MFLLLVTHSFPVPSLYQGVSPLWPCSVLYNQQGSAVGQFPWRLADRVSLFLSELQVFFFFPLTLCTHFGTLCLILYFMQWDFVSGTDNFRPRQACGGEWLELREKESRNHGNTKQCSDFILPFLEHTHTHTLFLTKLWNSKAKIASYLLYR